MIENFVSMPRAERSVSSRTALLGRPERLVICHPGSVPPGQARGLSCAAAAAATPPVVELSELLRQLPLHAEHLQPAEKGQNWPGVDTGTRWRRSAPRGCGLACSRLHAMITRSLDSAFTGRRFGTPGPAVRIVPTRCV